MGPVDKRVITYPLMKVLELSGKVLVITDDSCFRRFDDLLGTDFSLGQAHFIIRPKVSAETPTEEGFREEDFDYVVYITTNELIKDCDSLVYCHGVNRSLLSDDNLDFLEENPHSEVLISPNKILEKDFENKKSKVIKVDILKDMLHYVFSCEENRTFMYQTKPGSLIPNILANVFSDTLGIPASSIAKILERKE